MAAQVKVPAVGESVQEGSIHKWHKKDGDFVKVDDVLLELETDKATVEIVAEKSGQIKHQKKEGDIVKVGDVLATIDESVASPTPSAASTPSQPVASVESSAKPSSAPASPSNNAANLPASPAVQRIATESGLNPASVNGTGRDGRVTKGDMLQHLETKTATTTPSASAQIQPPAKTQTGTTPVVSQVVGERKITREPMTMMRRRIAERLISAQDTNAILTTFNEVDMSEIMELRTRHKDKFKEKHGVGLGFMSFFVKATIDALRSFPMINGHIDGTDIVKYSYYDVGVAISTERGLMVPVIRNADTLSMAGIEKSIVHFAEKARSGKISVDDLTGGTFTITNGGVFGSLVSTPIINPPQSAILGMHKIQERPVAIKGQVVIRPMMYLALSYDHRLIDGREAVTFLVKIKDAIEDPSRLLLEL